MSGLDIIRGEHRELVHLTAMVIEAASATPPDIEAIVAARRALGQCITRHIANKQTIVTAPLYASPVPEHRALARRFVDDLLKLRQSTSEHYGYWTIARIRDDLHGFRLGVRQQMKLLKARIEWEEREVFPLVAGLQATPPRQRLA